MSSIGTGVCTKFQCKLNFARDSFLIFFQTLIWLQQVLLLQYDLSASQFSPDGRVFQVEYAQKAVENSG